MGLELALLFWLLPLNNTVVNLGAWDPVPTDYRPAAFEDFPAGNLPESPPAQEPAPVTTVPFEVW